MRLVKATFFALLVLALLGMWTNRDYMADAYAITPNTLELRLSGVDLEIDRTEIDPSPFDIPAAPDTRRKPLGLLFTTTTTIEPPTVAMTDGESRLEGSAVGPDGPAFGGIVRIERHTSQGLGSVDARVGADGRWGIDGLPGGRYRIRAWVPGRLTMTASEVIFLEAEETAQFDFQLEEVDPQPELQFIHGGPIYEGLTGEVAVAVSQRVVDADGLILTTPVVGAVINLQPTSGVGTVGGASKITGADGAARFVLRCARVGSGNAIARYGAIEAIFALPGCRRIPPPPTTSAPTVPTRPEETTVPGSAGSPTTKPGSATGSGRTTTTQATTSQTAGLSTNG